MYSDPVHALKIRTFHYLEAIELLTERLLGQLPLTDATVDESVYRAAHAQKAIDTELLVEVLHRFNQHVTSRAKDLDDELLHDGVRHFHKVVGEPESNPGDGTRRLVNLRDIYAHLNEYDVPGGGRRRADGVLTAESPHMTWGKDRLEISYQGQHLDLTEAASAARLLAETVLTTLQHLSHEVDLRFWPRVAAALRNE